MMKKLSLLVGFAGGYVLGAKAGTQRYEEIVSKAREVAGMPAVQQATASVQDTASTLASQAKDTVNDKVSTATDKVEAKKSSSSSKTATPVVDLGATAPATTAPMAGAAASGTAPVVTPTSTTRRP
jgi:hypothetical protein